MSSTLESSVTLHLWNFLQSKSEAELQMVYDIGVGNYIKMLISAENKIQIVMKLKDKNMITFKGNKLTDYTRNIMYECFIFLGFLNIKEIANFVVTLVDDFDIVSDWGLRKEDTQNCILLAIDTNILPSTKIAFSLDAEDNGLIIPKLEAERYGNAREHVAKLINKDSAMTIDLCYTIADDVFIKIIIAHNFAELRLSYNGKKFCFLPDNLTELKCSNLYDSFVLLGLCDNEAFFSIVMRHFVLRRNAFINTLKIIVEDIDQYTPFGVKVEYDYIGVCFGDSDDEEGCYSGCDCDCCIDEVDKYQHNEYPDTYFITARKSFISAGL